MHCIEPVVPLGPRSRWRANVSAGASRLPLSATNRRSAGPRRRHTYLSAVHSIHEAQWYNTET
nr:hypothetical protein [Human alphaherpesvirus 2]